MDFLEDFSFIERYDTLVEEADSGEKKYVLRGVFGKYGIANKNKRIYPREVMEQCVNDLQPIIKIRGFAGELDHPCLKRNDFDVLTKNGWKPFKELKKGEEILSFDENNCIVPNKIEEIIDKPFKGKIYNFKGRNINSEFTGTHRFYLEDKYGKRVISTVKEIFDNRTKFNKHKIIKLGNWVGEDKDYISIPGTDIVKEPLTLNTKDFMAFMGIYLSEGSIKHTRKTDNFICIHQNEGLIADKIRKLLNKLPFEYKEYQNKRSKNISITFTIIDERLNSYLRILGNCYTKYIPYELKQLDAPYLEELIEWFILGDGRDQRHYEDSNRRNIFSVSKRLIEDLHELVIKCGGSGNWTEHESAKDYMFAGHLIEAKNKKTLYQLNISTTKGIYLDERFLKITEEDYNGNVYCLTVPNGNFYMKQDGKAFLTGNSTPKMNIGEISHYITKLALAEDGAVIGEIVPSSLPAGEKLKCLMRDHARLGVSTRGLGKVKPHNGSLGEGLVEVQPGYRMKAIDIVWDPSAEAYPEQVVESTDSGIILASTVNFRKVWENCFG